MQKKKELRIFVVNIDDSEPLESDWVGNLLNF